MRRRHGRLVAAAAIVAVLTGGCARYYWHKPQATSDQFAADSRACARAAAPNPTAASHGIVNDRLYRGCLTERGWTRDKQWEPPPAGWYRGFE
jgi:hypothetical protein